MKSVKFGLDASYVNCPDVGNVPLPLSVKLIMYVIGEAMTTGEPNAVIRSTTIHNIG